MHDSPKDWTQATDDAILDVDLITELGMAAEPDTTKQAFLEKMTDTVQRTATLTLLETLDETRKAELDQVLAHNDTDQLNHWITANVPDFNAMILAETIKFKRAMLTGKMPEKIS